MSDKFRNREAVSGVAARLAFFKGLQSITTRIHAATDVDEIIFQLSEEMCELFDAERLTIYIASESSKGIYAKVKTGLDLVQRIELPVDDKSIAGYVALTCQTLNIPDAYDAESLKRISPRLTFRSEVDEATGFRSREMLVGPIIHPDTGEVQGVVQLINNKLGGPFPAVKEEGLPGLTQTLAVAFIRRASDLSMLRSRFDALVADGRLTASELDQAMRTARETASTVELVLQEQFKLSLAELGEAASRYFHVPYEPFRNDRIKQVDLMRNIKREYVEQNHWLPLEETPEGLVLLTTDPEQVRLSRVARNVFPKSHLVMRVTTLAEFAQTVDQFFESSLDTGSVADLISNMSEEEPEYSVADDVSAAADNELVKLVNKIIIDAYRQGASDIHIEPRPGKEKTLIRFRKDGTLVPYLQVPASYRNPLVTRIKIMCDLDIAERRRPQDGKIKFRKFAPLDVELRVATLPTAGGLEDVVMRVLSGGEPIPLDALGLSPSNMTRLKQIVKHPYGIFFVCGPTGSGKTTTLHSILGDINTGETKIWTAEDPIEITQKGLRQVQVNRKAGLDFAALMRAFLRADPDVIMVGEMRDLETAAIGIEASLTGHLVFSTLHTNSAPESLVRLLDMGMDPFNFADALLGVLAQRLAKRLCAKCREAYYPDEAEVERLLHEYCEDMHLTPDFVADPQAAIEAIRADWLERFADRDGRFTLYRPVGCSECTGGYKGRVGLHELMPGSPQLKRLVQARARVDDLLAAALAEGMRTLRQDGIEKTLSGITDMAQVRRVCVR